MSKIQTIAVKHAGGKYLVHVGAGACEKMGKYISHGEVLAVSNRLIWRKHKARLENLTHEVFTCMPLQGGERHKSLRAVEKIIDKLVEKNMHRDGTVIAFGGGTVGDIAGFATAIYMRGVNFVQVPTSLLAMVDAAVGGKTGVNHKSGKNLIGAFYQPRAVICDTDFLQTLPKRQYCAGLAEVVKYGLLGDKDFFAWIEKNAEELMDYKAPGNSAVQEAIVRSVKMKAEIVAEDERETGGRRALLNLGHTFAHAAENAAGYSGEWIHGKAVAAGLVAAAKLSEKEKGFPKKETARIIALLKKFKLPVSFRGLNTDKIYNAMSVDKKFTTTQVRFVLMDKIGRAKLCEIEMHRLDKVKETLEEMQ